MQQRVSLPLVPLLWRCALLVAVACAVGLAVNAARPAGLPLVVSPTGTPCPGVPRAWWDRIDRQPAAAIHTLWEHQGAAFIDAREHDDYIYRHLPGAYEVPYSKFSTAFPQVRPQLPAGQPVVVYGTDKPCDQALRVAKYLVDEYGDHVILLTGGFPAWEQAGFPTQPGHTRGEVGVAP